MPFCFAMNLQNCARYGTYYCYSLIAINDIHPGAKREVMESICRNYTGIRQSIDAAGVHSLIQYPFYLQYTIANVILITVI